MSVGNAPPPSIRVLARRLLVIEAARETSADTHEAVRVCATLGVALVRFAGKEGYTSLLRRALALARAEVPALESVSADADGSLEGYEQVVRDANGSDLDPAIAVTAHLLGLLVTFIGEPLTLRLVRDAWPHALLDVWPDASAGS